MVRGRKITGGKYKKFRKKKLHSLPGKPRPVTLGEEKKKKIRGRGGNYRTVLIRANKVNVIDTKTHKSKLVAIKNVLEVPSNIFLARKNILVKGAIIETELGRAKITNRPGQESHIQAVLIS